MHHARSARVGALILLTLSIGGAQGGQPAAAAAPAAAVFEELGGEKFVFELIRHLYRWYLDESDVGGHLEHPAFDVWARRLDVQLDPGDESRLAEVVIPIFNVYVTVKKASYRVEELDLEVRGRQFRIINVSRDEPPADPPAEYEVRAFNMPAVIDYLFRTRNLREYPDESLFERLRQALRAEVRQQAEARQAPAQIVHIGPLSPVANELWVFWETGRMLIRFSSDVDIDNPEVWKHERLQVRTFDIDRQVVISLSEVPGSNAFLTRDQVGRVLYNCVVLGQRRETPTEQAPEVPAPAASR